MDVFTMVVLIVLVCVGADSYNRYLKAKKKQPPPIDHELEQDIQELRDRIAVLEKIVTDEKYQLQRDINAL